MANARQQKDLATRLDELKHLIKQLQQDIQDIRDEGEIAPSGCWIVRYQAKGKRVVVIGITNGCPMSRFLSPKMAILLVINI
ncbi:hypothetical protein [Pleurocapsa sp. PCC 7319]|uniref:hypothetical protein n=1 Tax=Pleurocapsa sp. PCC 7319 TaxID=118161 RepID=UPI0003476239|nr:hypothetical protein [Pleurocapsa sp. PCC 7319]